jgi:hypothetical protein
MFSTYIGYSWLFLWLPQSFSTIFLLPCDCLSKPLDVHLSLSTIGLSNSLFYLSFSVVFPRVVVAPCCGKAQFCTFLAPFLTFSHYQSFLFLVTPLLILNF